MNMICSRCGREVARTGMNQRYCPECAKRAKREYESRRRRGGERPEAYWMRAEAHICLGCTLPRCMGVQAEPCPLRQWKKQRGAQV